MLPEHRCPAYPRRLTRGIGHRLHNPGGGGMVLGFSPVPHGDSVSTLVANLLPQANAGLASVAKEVYVGEGLPPVPVKVAAKIQTGGLWRRANAC